MVINLNIKQFDIHLVNLDPTIGKEIKKKRPCVVVSPNVMNTQLGTLIIAPLTSTCRDWPTRVKIKLNKKDGEVCLDQIRTIDEKRLGIKLGSASPKIKKKLSDILIKMFRI